MIIKMQFGSHVYGTNVSGSDLDFKAIYLPSARELLLGKVTGARNETTRVGRLKNTAGDIDLEVFSLQKYMSLLCEGQTVALDMLFTPCEWWLESSEIWEKILGGREKWLHKGVSKYAEYCRSQANKYGIKGSRVAVAREAVRLFEALMWSHPASTKLVDVWPVIAAFSEEGHEHVSIVTEERGGVMLEVCNRKVQQHASIKMGLSIYRKLLDEYGDRALRAEKNEGVDWKALMHAVRVCHQAQELLGKGEITFPRPEAKLLLAIRQGEMSYQAVAEIIERGLEQLEFCQKASTLRDEPDFNAAEDLVYSAHREVVLQTPKTVVC